MERNLYIAAYDVADDARLRAALRVLKNYSTGGQRSVFECFLTAGERRSLLRETTATINLDEDKFLLVRLDPRSEVVCLGVAVPPVDPDYYYVG